MSFIPCTNNCKYQSEGVCTLETSFFDGVSLNSGCIHYVPKPESKYNENDIKKINKTFEI